MNGLQKIYVISSTQCIKLGTISRVVTLFPSIFVVSTMTIGVSSANLGHEQPLSVYIVVTSGGRPPSPFTQTKWNQDQYRIPILEEGSPKQVLLSEGTTSLSTTPHLNMHGILPSRIPRTPEEVAIVMSIEDVTYLQNLPKMDTMELFLDYLVNLSRSFSIFTSCS